MKCLAVTLVCALSLLAQSKPLPNQDVIDMVRNGMSNADIIDQINKTQVNFDLTPSSLVSLHAAGLEGMLIDNMILTGSRRGAIAPASTTGAAFPAKDYIGHTVRVTAWIRTENVLNGYAGVWLNIGAPGKTLAFDNSQNRFIDGKPAPGNGDIRGASGTTAWKQYQVELTVPDGAANAGFGTLVTGSGTAWFDAFAVEVDGIPWTNPSLDFDFESPELKGFHKGGQGYDVVVDNATAYTGHQSLKVTFTGQTAKPTAPALTNDDILTMSRGGVLARNIITDIANTPVKFDVSPDALLALRAAGVADTVVRQMQPAGTRVKYANTFGVATGTFPIAAAAGHTIRLSVWIKTDHVEDGYAGPWWRVDGSDKQGAMLAFDNSRNRVINNEPAAGSGTVRGATGTTDWARYQFDLPVAPNAKNINFGVLLTGTGTAWVDKMSVEIDGVPWSDPKQFDFDFESTTPKGFYAGGQGYRVGVDNTVAYSGAQSLKLQFIGDDGSSK